MSAASRWVSWGALCVVATVSLGCSSDRSTTGSKGSTKKSAEEALMHAMSFPGRDTQLMPLSIGAPSVDVMLLPLDSSVRAEAGTDSSMGFDFDTDEQAPECVLMQFGDTNKHLRVTTKPTERSRIELAYQVAADACDELCARPYLLSLFSALELASGEISEYTQLTMLFDCRDHGDPALCNDTDRAQTADTAFLEAVERIERTTRVVVPDAGMPSDDAGADADVDASANAGDDAGPLPVPQSPVAQAFGDQSVLEGALVELSASASDSDGSVASTRWEQRSGPNVTLVEGDEPFDVSFVAPDVKQSTVFTFAFVVVDDQGFEDEATVSVFVMPLNQAPSVDAGSDFNQNEGSTVSTMATAADSDGTIVTWLWEQLGGPTVTLAGAATDTVSFTAPVVPFASAVVLRVTVTDDEGTSASDFVLVTVDPVNLAPTVNAGLDQQVNAEATVQLLGTASDADGDIASVHWRQLWGQAVSLSASDVLDPSFVAPQVNQPATLRFELAVTDDRGAVAVDQVDVVVRPPPVVNVPPVVYAGPDQIVASGSTVSLAGVATDSDGSVSQVIWTVLGSGGPAIANAASLSGASFVAPAVDCATQFVLRVEVQDDEGGTASDQVAIMVLSDLANQRSLPLHLPLESDDGGLSRGGTLGDEWAWGVPTSGPGAAHEGTRVWATNLAGNYRDNANEWLCLPPVDLGGATDATLSFRFWVYALGGDGVRVQGLDPNAGWSDLTTVEPSYADAIGHRAVGYFDEYALGLAKLPSWLGPVAQLRFLFHSNLTGAAAGAYLDELRIDDESSDPDGDSLTGVWNEYLTHGTDPFLSDSDGDGDSDGDELVAGSNPLNPAMSLAAPTITVGTLLDFESGDDGGLATTGSLWQHGTPSSGPPAAHSGTSLWATSLSGNYFVDAREYLNLPAIDLRDAGGPATLSFRLWAHSGNAGMGIEYFDGDEWRLLPVAVPGYDGQDGASQPAFVVQHYQNDYVLVAASLAAFEGQRVQLRFSFRSRCCSTGPGAYIDDLRVDLESSDPDGDGLNGVLGEAETYGTDPFVFDTDGDGIDDGSEITSGSDPLIAASNNTVTPLTPGAHLDLEQNAGGLSTDGTLWQYGAIASGPFKAHGPGELHGWATNLSGNYFIDAREYLYLPPIDLTDASDPTLSFRLWSRTSGNHGTSLEVRRPGGGWTALAVAAPAYDVNDPIGRNAWGSQGYQTQYVLAAASLANYVGEQIDVRIVFRSQCCGVAAGTYIDEIRLDEETSDPDGDGLPGVLGELLADMPSDPYVYDSDGDGVSDGDEVAADRDPSIGSDYPGGPVWTPGVSSSLETDDGGLWPNGTLWQYGAPASGPCSDGACVAHTGSRVWATNLTGNYRDDSSEYLYLPPFDLSEAVTPVLGFHAFCSSANGDGMSVEIYDPEYGWLNHASVTPAYSRVDGANLSAYGNLGTGSTYEPINVDLSAVAGSERVLVRLTYRARCCGVSSGCYLDDFELN